MLPTFVPVSFSSGIGLPIIDHLALRMPAAELESFERRIVGMAVKARPGGRWEWQKNEALMTWELVDLSTYRPRDPAQR